MNLQRSTRYALYAALEMASAPADGLVTASAVAAKYGLPPSVVAKILQVLARAGLAIGSRGTTGGYRLARPAASITVLEIVDRFERAVPPASRGATGVSGADPDPRRAADARLRALFAELDEQARATLASVSLATLVAPRTARPASLRS